MGWDNFWLPYIGVAASAVVLLVALYVLGGGKKLWGPERGIPFCGHPFEQVDSMLLLPDKWTCPRCGTTFERRGEPERWVPRRD